MQIMSNICMVLLQGFRYLHLPWINIKCHDNICYECRSVTQMPSSLLRKLTDIPQNAIKSRSKVKKNMTSVLETLQHWFQKTESELKTKKF